MNAARKFSPLADTLPAPEPPVRVVLRCYECDGDGISVTSGEPDGRCPRCRGEKRLEFFVDPRREVECPKCGAEGEIEVETSVIRYGREAATLVSIPCPRCEGHQELPFSALTVREQEREIRAYGEDYEQ